MLMVRRLHGNRKCSCWVHKVLSMGYNITNTHNPTTPKKPQVPNNPTTPKKPQVPNNENKVIPKAYTQGKTYDKNK